MSERKSEVLAGFALVAIWIPVILTYAGAFDKWIF